MIYEVKYDDYFHDLINEENIDIVEWIVIHYLNLSYEEVHGNCRVKNIRLLRVNKKDRNRYVDLMITYKNNILVFELNNNFKGVLIRNIVYGMTKIINSYKYTKNNYYKNKIRLSVINLNWYNERNKKEKIPLIKRDIVFGHDDEEKGIFFEVVNINLDKYATLEYNKIDTGDKFYKLLTINTKKELLEFTKDEQLLKLYVKRILELSSNSKYWEDKMTYEMDKKLREMDLYLAGLEDGEEKGSAQKNKEIVLNMVKDKVPLNLISKYTKVSIRKIKEIIKTDNMILNEIK